MLNQRLLSLFLAASMLWFLGCTSPTKEVVNSPMQILIGDGGVRIEQSHKHFDAKARAVAAFKSEHEKFRPSQEQLKGQVWLEESSEFELNENPLTHCDITIKRQAMARQVSSESKNYVYQIKVRVSDGIKNSPFESIINGESEGMILFGEYPANDWQSTENLVLDETVIASWWYEPEKKHYEIVKKMGQSRYLKKVLKFDPYLKEVTRVEYQILKDTGDQVDQQMTPLAKLSCS